jgi:hypothetical protein
MRMSSGPSAETEAARGFVELRRRRRDRTNPRQGRPWPCAATSDASAPNAARTTSRRGSASKRREPLDGLRVPVDRVPAHQLPAQKVCVPCVRRVRRSHRRTGLGAPLVTGREPETFENFLDKHRRVLSQ